MKNNIIISRIIVVLDILSFLGVEIMLNLLGVDVYGFGVRTIYGAVFLVMNMYLFFNILKTKDSLLIVCTCIFLFYFLYLTLSIYAAPYRYLSIPLGLLIGYKLKGTH